MSADRVSVYSAAATVNAALAEACAPERAALNAASAAVRDAEAALAAADAAVVAAEAQLDVPVLTEAEELRQARLLVRARHAAAAVDAARKARVGCLAAVGVAEARESRRLAEDFRRQMREQSTVAAELLRPALRALAAAQSTAVASFVASQGAANGEPTAVGAGLRYSQRWLAGLFDAMAGEVGLEFDARQIGPAVASAPNPMLDAARPSPADAAAVTEVA